MTRQPVTSASIKSIGHDGDVLEIEFASGTTYRYTGVPRHVYDGLLAAKSIGAHFQRHVRSAGFAHTRVDPEPERAA